MKFTYYLLFRYIRLFEGGIYDHWYSTALRETQNSFQTEPNNMEFEFIDLSVSRLNGVYIFLFIGLNVSMLTFLTEITVFAGCLINLLRYIRSTITRFIALKISKV